MSPNWPTIGGWDLTDVDGSYATYLREDRLAKITVMPVSFAGRPDGHQATLWMKDEPHGRSWRETSIANDQITRFKEQLRVLADEAPRRPE